MTAEGSLSLSPADDAVLRYPYPYTPFLAVLWSPLAGLPLLSQMALYGLLNLAAFTVGLCLLLAALPLPGRTRLLFLLGALTSFPFINNLEQGQSSGLVMLALGGGIALMLRGKNLPAGLMLGLLVIKVQWLPLLVLVLLFKRQWRTLAGMLATGAVLCALSVLLMGTGWIGPYLSVLGQAQGYSRALLLDPLYSHSFGGGLAALLAPGDDTIRTASLVCTLACAGLLLAAWRGPWQPGSLRWAGLMALTIVAAVFSNVHVNTHDLCLLALPAALGCAYIAGSNAADTIRTLWYGLLWAAYIVPAFLLPQTFAWPVRMTTLIMLLMLGLLAWQLLSVQQKDGDPLASQV